MPAIPAIMLSLHSFGLNFSKTMLYTVKITPAIPVIMLNTPSIGLNFADFMLNIPSVGLNFPKFMPYFGIFDPT
jgi:hypothetical protein